LLGFGGGILGEKERTPLSLPLRSLTVKPSQPIFLIYTKEKEKIVGFMRVFVEELRLLLQQQ
jgi:hypothetical protein